MTDPMQTDLHSRIMNLPCNVPSGYPYGSELCVGVYREGHRDARHAAAELANEYASELRSLRDALALAKSRIAEMRDALEEIALAGMSGTGQESEEGMRAWHARRAWEFIGIAARALSPARAALKEDSK